MDKLKEGETKTLKDKEAARAKREKDLKQARESIANDPLLQEKNKEFCLEFLTNFILKGYAGENKVDITESGFPTVDKNNLKLAGIVNEDLDRLTIVDSIKNNSQLPSAEALESNKNLYKKLFCSFKMNIKLLALKKLSMMDKDSISSSMPAQFYIRFKFYNFEWYQSDLLFRDPLTPSATN